MDALEQRRLLDFVTKFAKRSSALFNDNLNKHSRTGILQTFARFLKPRFTTRFVIASNQQEYLEGFFATTALLSTDYNLTDTLATLRRCITLFGYIGALKKDSCGLNSIEQHHRSVFLLNTTGIYLLGMLEAYGFVINAPILVLFPGSMRSANFSLSAIKVSVTMLTSPVPIYTGMNYREFLACHGLNDAGISLLLPLFHRLMAHVVGDFGPRAVFPSRPYASTFSGTQPMATDASTSHALAHDMPFDRNDFDQRMQTALLTFTARDDSDDDALIIDESELPIINQPNCGLESFIKTEQYMLTPLSPAPAVNGASINLLAPTRDQPALNKQLGYASTFPDGFSAAQQSGIHYVILPTGSGFADSQPSVNAGGQPAHHSGYLQAVPLPSGSVTDARYFYLLYFYFFF